MLDVDVNLHFFAWLLMSQSAVKEFPAMQRMMSMRLLLESRIRQPERLNPGVS